MSGALDGSVAVVTGGSRGIGRAIVDSFLRAGAAVAFCSRDHGEREAAAAALSAAHPGARLLAEPCDVADPLDVVRFAAAVRHTLGPPTIVVANAGIVRRGRLEEQSPADWREVVEVNLFGAYHATRAFLPDLRRAGHGRIIHIASISGRLGTPMLTAYCAAKHAVVGLTRALAEELREHHIQVNAICPGSVDTRMLEGSGFAPDMTPEEVAKVALFLATTAPAALTGSCLDVFG